MYNDNRQRFKSRLRAMACSVSCALLISGCAVKPDPFSMEEHITRAQYDMRQLLYKSRPIEQDLTLADAVARGLVDNLDHRMAMMEETLKQSRLSLVNYEMLPSLAANAGYRWRDKVSASSSESVVSGTQSLESSFSSERTGASADLSFNWNLLDFGLSYFQAKQQADEVSIAVEVRRRVMNNTTREIVSAYYRALYAQNLLPRVEKAITRAEKAIAASDKIRKDQLVPAQQMLSYKRDLLQSLLTLKNLQSELHRARQELATLLNVPADESLRLVAADKQPKLPKIKTDLHKLQDRALVYRPELREETYKERIDRQSIHAETLKMFPGLSMISSINTDTNKYLYYNNWRELSLRATWNLIDVLKAYKGRDIAKAQVEYGLMRRLALSSAILAQTAISYYQYGEASNNYKTASSLSDVEGKLLKAARDSEEANTGSRLESVRQEVLSLSAAIAAGRSYAEAQTALAGLMVSVGYDLIPAESREEDVNALSARIAPILSALQKGEMPDMDDTVLLRDVVQVPAPAPVAVKSEDVKKEDIKQAAAPQPEKMEEAVAEKSQDTVTPEPQSVTSKEPVIEPAAVAVPEPAAEQVVETATPVGEEPASPPVPAEASHEGLKQKEVVQAQEEKITEEPAPKSPVETAAEPVAQPVAAPASAAVVQEASPPAAQDASLTPEPFALPAATPAAPEVQKPKGSSDCILRPKDNEDSDRFMNRLKRRFFPPELECDQGAANDL